MNWRNTDHHFLQLHAYYTVEVRYDFDQETITRLRTVLFKISMASIALGKTEGTFWLSTADQATTPKHVSIETPTTGRMIRPGIMIHHQMYRLSNSKYM